MSSILITGSASGLGAALVKALAPWNIIHEFDLKHGNNVVRPDRDHIESIGAIDVLINCAGVNYIDWLENFDEADWDAVMDANAKGIFKMTQACLPALIKSRGTVVNIVSNASHTPMTCSLAYNASKGAAHIMTLQLARELTKKYGITVFGVSPNKLAGTEMSKEIDEQVVLTRGWAPEFAREYQLKSLLAGAETPPELVAEFVAFLLADKDRHRFLTGCVIPYGA